MKTLINNSATGLMIGGILVIIVAGCTHLNGELAAGALLVIGSAIAKALAS